MNVYFVNKTPYVLQLYWLDGNRGKEQSQILAGNSYMLSTFISHSFFARASFVEGYSLTNEVCLTSRNSLFAVSVLTIPFY